MGTTHSREADDDDKTSSAEQVVGVSGCLWIRAAMQPEQKVHPTAMIDTLKYSVTPPQHLSTHIQSADSNAANINQDLRDNNGVSSARSPTHQKNLSVSTGIDASGNLFRVATSSPQSPQSPQSTQSHLFIPSTSTPFLGRPVQIGTGLSSQAESMNLNSNSHTSSSVQWHSHAMILDSSDALWNAWMTTESWLQPPWFVSGASVSAQDEALIKESIVALHTGKPYRDALRKETIKRQQQQAQNHAGQKNTSSVSLPAFDAITFLSFHFYEGLFFTLPAIRRQFKSPIEIQGKKMVETLVHMLTRFATESRSNCGSDTHIQLMEQFKDMCRRHLKYNVKMNQVRANFKKKYSFAHMCTYKQARIEYVSLCWFVLAWLTL